MTDSVFDRGRDQRPGQMATARWALLDGVQREAADGRLRFRPGGVWLGTTPDDHSLPVGWHDDRHMVTIAGSRAGKGRSLIIPNLLLYPGSVVCIDPKGENARETAEIRAANARNNGLGQTVYVLDPYNVTDLPSALRGSFNPLSSVNPSARDAVEQAGLIADALVVPANAQDAHWDESARSLIEALILHVCTDATFEDRRTLTTVRELLMHGDTRARSTPSGFPVSIATELEPEPPTVGAFELLLSEMEENSRFGNVIAGQARALRDLGPEEFGSVFSTARRNTKFIDGSAMAEVLGDRHRPLDFSYLKKTRNGVSVYVCLPTRYLNTHSRWLRLVLVCLMEAMERHPAAPSSGCPVLAICDEFPVLGPLKVLETAIGYMAGYHLKIWAILQDISQLRRDYPQSWETFLGNAGLIQFFANSDFSTLEFLSKRLGDAEIVRLLETSSIVKGQATQELSPDARRIAGLSPNAPSNLSGQYDTTSRSAHEDVSEARAEHLFKTPLMTPDEIASHFRRNTELQGVISADFPPFRLYRTDHDAPENRVRWIQFRSEARLWRDSLLRA